jgi:hypothetical protein
LKRASMLLWAGISGFPLFASAVGTDVLQASGSKAAAHRVNELTLAGLRPGRDTAARAISKYKEHFRGKLGDSEYSWNDDCRHEVLSAEIGPSGTAQEIRVAESAAGRVACAAPARSPWRTGNNLAVGDSTSRVIRLYGEPDSRSPSTKDGQRLELLYYAFDWAGADVPQVMEVLCTVAKDGKPGRVIEITLAASSL